MVILMQQPNPGKKGGEKEKERRVRERVTFAKYFPHSSSREVGRMEPGHRVLKVRLDFLC